MRAKTIDKIALVVVTTGVLGIVGSCLYHYPQITLSMVGFLIFLLSAVWLMDRSIDKDLEESRKRYEKTLEIKRALDHMVKHYSVESCKCRESHNDTKQS